MKKQIDSRIPKNFPGGYSYSGEFKEEPLEPGQVWRNRGPVNAFKIVGVFLPGFDNYDGAAPGVSCRHSKISNGRIVWGRQVWFHLAKSQEDFWQMMRKDGRVPVV